MDEEIYFCKHCNGLIESFNEAGNHQCFRGKDHIYQDEEDNTIMSDNFIREMENYTKGKNVEEELERCRIPIKDLPENFLWMQVKGGSKMANLISHAAGIIEDKSSRVVVWSGAGVAIPKAISCAEILKKQFSIEHQVTKLTFKSVEEYWEPKLEGLETLVVKRQIPIIHILLSLDAVPDTNQVGYQTLKGKKFWQKDHSSQQSKQPQSYKSKKPFKHKKT